MVQCNIVVQTCAVQFSALWPHVTVEQLRCKLWVSLHEKRNVSKFTDLHIDYMLK